MHNDPAAPALHAKTLFIIRGAPGSGKSELALKIAPAANYSADLYFEKLAHQYASTYEQVWTPDKLAEAHQFCQDRTRQAMTAGIRKVAVANTFRKRWEIEPYAKMAREFGYLLNVIRLENDFGNIHGVPEDRVAQIRSELEDWIDAEPEKR